jgi:competence protein ComEC
MSGLSDGVVCSVCNITITAQTTIAPLGHSWKDATTEAPKTCTVCGATEGDKLSTPSGYSDTLYVSYINVGQGDSILIQVGDCDILIDAGTASYGTTVSSYLRSRGVDDIELLINTHPDADHCGGLTKVLTDFVVEEAWISKDTSKTSAAYTNFISAISSEGLTAKKPNAGQVYTYEYLTMTVLYSAVGSDANNSSIVIMLEYGSFKFLFTGDAGEEVENKLVSSGADLSCDVLKVGHHGSKYSSTTAFLNKTGAKYGVICVGSNNYGHPTSEALSRLTSAGISVYRTDKDGNVVFSTDGATLTLPGGSSVSGGSGSGTTGGSSSGSSSSGSSSSGSSSSGSSSSTQMFIGNTESKVFHLPTCSSLPAASKQNTMYDYWWIINIAGYTPCGRCLKNYTPDSGSVSGTAYIANTESKVYHLFTCSNLPAASKQTIIYNTSGYTPCGRCIKSSATSYIANKDSKVYHLSTCSNLPSASNQVIIYDTTGYTPCGRCISKSSVNAAVNTSAKAYANNTYALRLKITLY